jgi:hypothetical protein
MGKHHLRKDMTCLNCSQVVEKRYCPNCGQENTDTRKTFHHLFVHFFEDLTHYENAFWKTIQNLLFRPGSLTREYMSGKRMSYLAPVRLYIFISFVTFFLLGVLPTNETETDDKGDHTVNNTNINFNGPNSKEAKAFTDSLKTKKLDNGLQVGDYASLGQFDSVQKTLPESKKATGFVRWLQRRLAKVNGDTTPQEFRKKFGEAISHNIPKALFLYMPFFAFFVWLFHDKKRWYYFDHGIFTLHYFSFLLLTLSAFLIIQSLSSFVGEWLDDFVAVFILALMIWWFFYFFRSHRRFYGESKAVSRLKSLALFVINVFFLVFFVIGLMIYTALYLE